jgi:hypothetical protein
MSELPKPSRESRHWLEYVSTFVAVVISVVSLWVAIGSEQANRQMVAASSWPILIVGSSNVGDNEAQLSFHIANDGVGPAKVRTFEVFYKGRPYSTSDALMRACCDPEFKATRSPSNPKVEAGAFITGYIAGSVIPAGQHANFISYALNSQNSDAWHALDAARQSDMSYRVCYCSVFDECWINTIGNQQALDPKRIDTCPIPPVPYTE